MFMERMKVITYSAISFEVLLCFSVYFSFLLGNKRKKTQFMKITEQCTNHFSHPRSKVFVFKIMLHTELGGTSYYFHA